MAEQSTYEEVAAYAESNVVHPNRVLIAYHIRAGRYDLALQLLKGDASPPDATDGKELPGQYQFPELELMIENLRKAETPVPSQDQE